MSRCLTTAPRSPRSAQLLRTTALLTLIPLLAATQPAFAQMVLDNGNAPISTGTTAAVTGDWSMGDEIWWDEDTGQYAALGNGQTGVLTNPDPAGVTLTLNNTIDIGGLDVDSNGFTLTGGTLTNSAGVLALNATTSGTRLTVFSALEGDISVDGGLELRHRDTSANVGTIEIKTGSTLSNAGSITGTIDNKGTFNQQNIGSVTGDVTNSGTMNMSGDATDKGTVNGNVTNSGALNMTDAVITGTLDNQTGARLNISAAVDATINGDVQNDGEIIGVTDETKLVIGGRLTSSGRIDTDKNNDTFTITADEILITDWSDVDRDVILNGTRVNQTSLAYNNDTTLSEDVIRGGILNEDGGSIRVRDDLDASTFDITNESSFTIESANWPSTNSVTNVTKFSNSGSNAELTIGSRGALSAQTVENSGEITNYGSLEGLNTIAAPVHNLEFGVLNNYGTITGDVKNDAGATIANDGTIIGNVTNAGTLDVDVDGSVNGFITNSIGGKLTSTGTIGGLSNYSADVDNSIAGTVTGNVTNRMGALLTSTADVGGGFTNNGTATVSGKIDGVLTNQQATGGAVPSLTLGGDLEVGGLINGASITIDDNWKLTTNSPASNTGTLTVDGELVGNVGNAGTLDVDGDGSVNGFITNSIGGKLTSTGIIGGLSNYSANVENSIAGNVTGNVTNRTGALLISTADVGGTFMNNGTATVSGKITGLLTNQQATGGAVPSLTLGGDLEVGGLTNSASITIDDNRKLTTSSAASNTGTLTVDGELVGSVGNTGTLDVDGTVTGAITNSIGGKLTSTGTIGGLSNYSADAGNSIAGAVTGNVTNRSGALLTSTADVGGTFTNNGTATVSGKITGVLTNQQATGGTVPSLTLGGNLEVGGLTNDASITIASNRTLTSASAVDNSGRLDVDGKLAGAVDNGGTLDVTGTVTGKVTNASGATLTSTGTIGALKNESVNANISGTVTGDVENTDDGTLISSAAIGGDVTNDGNATLSNSVAGDVTNDGTLVSSAAIGGNVTNDHIATLSNSVAGAITNDGTLNITGSLTTGANVAASDPTITNTGTINLSGNLTGRIQNDDRVNMTGGTLTGSLVNNDRLNLSGTNSIIGDLTSTGTIMGVSTDANLSLTDGIFYLTDGEVNVTAGNSLTITADLIEIGSGADYQNANVTLIGGLANSGTMNLSDADTLEGDLLNRATGNATISAAIDAAGYDVTNEGDFLVTSDSNSVGNLHSVGTLTNSGTFDIDAGTTVSATNTANTAGSLIVGGTLNTTLDNQLDATLDMDGGTVIGAVTNAGQVTGNGTINGKLTNNGLVRVDTGDTLTSTQRVDNNKTVELDGTLAANLLNNAAGTVTMDGGTISGTVNNRGRLNGTGEISGQLSNWGIVDLGGSLQGVTNAGTLGTNGDLSVASLTNTGTVNVDTGDTLSSTATVENSKTLNVAGTLDAALTNNANATTELSGGTLGGAVTNNGNLTGNGTIEGVLTNNRTATIAGTAGEIVNSGTLTSTGDLDIQTLTNTGTTTVRGNTTMTIETPFSNQGSLNVAGNLVTTVGNRTGATTTLTGGTITGNVRNAGDLGGNGRITGILTNVGTVEIKTGNNLTIASTNNQKTLDIAGTLTGALSNQAAGITTLNGGTINGRVSNYGTLQGFGTITGSLTNANMANLGGVLGAVTNSGTLTTYGPELTVASLDNSGKVSISVDEQLIVKGSAINRASGTVAVNDGSRLVGSILNHGTISGNGTITGTLTNDGGTLDIDGSMTVGDLSNIGAMTLAAGDTLISQQQAENTGQLTVQGRLAADLLNNGRVNLGGGTITGDVINQAGKLLAGTGTISGDLTNMGVARLAGSVGAVVNSNQLETNGLLSVASLSNSGTVTVKTGEELKSASAVENTGQLNLSGKLSSGLNNRDGATTSLTGGTVTGNIVNEGELNGTGAISGTLINRAGTSEIGGTIGIDLINLGGKVTTASDLTVEGRILNSASETLTLRQRSPVLYAASNPGLITITAGTTTTAKLGTQNGPGATLQVDGTLVSNVLNNGTVVNAGKLTGDVTNLGSFASSGQLNGSIVSGYYDKTYYDTASATLNGTVTGDVTYAAGTLDLENGLRIGGSLNLLKSYTIADGTRINAGQTLVGSGTMLSLGGTVGGKVVNEGTIKLTDGSAAITGNLENNATVDLRDGNASTVLTTKGLSGTGVIAMDVFTGENLSADKVVVSGGATTGHINLTFAELPTAGGAAIGKWTTLVDVDDAYTNNYTYAAASLSASSERIVYSVEKAANGDIQLVSQINPAIGAMFANVTLVQSLIGSVINRPTSPYVTGLVTDYADKPCGVGGWGRATGGNATVKGKTDNQVSVAENEVSASYYGMQGGVDLVCFDDRYAGWDLSLGVLGGVNIGDSRQPIYAIDSRNSQASTGVLASVTTTDFQQVYGGVYMTGTKGRWTADLQLRGEKTDFELENTPVRGSGLRVQTPDFSSDGVTLSGSLAYSMPVKDTGWIFTPNVGFAWSKYSTDSIRFDGDFELEFDDSERQIGFVGASIGKTFVYESQNAAIHTFATATYFKDFADDAVSRLYNTSLEGYETQILTSENLKNYGEVSVGANYVKVLNPGKSGRPRQLSTSARIDGRFGDSIDSVGVTGQFRLQF